MQTIRVFDAFAPGLELNFDQLNEWAVEAFRHLREQESSRSKLMREVAPADLTDEQVLRFLLLAAMQHFIGGHDDDCALRYAGNAIRTGVSVSPFVETVRETLVTKDEGYSLAPTMTSEEFLEHIYDTAPPEVKADWDNPRTQRTKKKFVNIFEDRRADMVKSFTIADEHGTKFEKALNWQTIEIEDVQEPDHDGIGDILDGLLRHFGIDDLE